MFDSQNTPSFSTSQPATRHIQRDELPVAVTVTDPDRFCIFDYHFIKDNPIKCGATVTLIARPAGMFSTYSFQYQTADGDTLRGVVFEGGFATTEAK